MLCHTQKLCQQRQGLAIAEAVVGEVGIVELLDTLSAEAVVVVEYELVVGCEPHIELAAPAPQLGSRNKRLYRVLGTTLGTPVASVGYDLGLGREGGGNQ